MKVLVVEDDEFKLKHVQRLLLDFPKFEALFAKSISSSMRQLEQHPDLIAVILDMSLPTFDVDPGESGGRPQGFGGLSVMQHLDSLDLTAMVIVLTQFLQFGEGESSIDISGLESQLKADYPENFMTLIRYGAGSDQWKDDLAAALSSISEAG